MIVGMNHFTVTAVDERETLDFYVGLLGLKPGLRPDLGFPGAWLYADGAPSAMVGQCAPSAMVDQSAPSALVHLYFGRPVPTQRTGVIDHMAFTARDLKAVKARFDARGVKYELRRQAGAGTWQLFCHDPNGARVELDFDAAESPD